MLAAAGLGALYYAGAEHVHPMLVKAALLALATPCHGAARSGATLSELLAEDHEATPIDLLLYDDDDKGDFRLVKAFKRIVQHCWGSSGHAEGFVERAVVAFDERVNVPFSAQIFFNTLKLAHPAIVRHLAFEADSVAAHRQLRSRSQVALYAFYQMLYAHSPLLSVFNVDMFDFLDGQCALAQFVCVAPPQYLAIAFSHQRACDSLRAIALIRELIQTRASVDWAQYFVGVLQSTTLDALLVLSVKILKICSLVAKETMVSFWSVATACLESQYFHASINYADFFLGAHQAADEEQHADAKFALFARVLQHCLESIKRDVQLIEGVPSVCIAPTGVMRPLRELLAPLLALALPEDCAFADPINELKLQIAKFVFERFGNGMVPAVAA
ncbi:hypothetical protein T492DRAFT_879901 [Pavlovales sp. CCMP2436]|nr:hypothetical protein T492DRAFT_879901 [Pavlovales sp. CCMP2436]